MSAADRGIRVGDVVTLTVSDAHGRILPPWPYRLEGLEFRAEPGQPTEVCRGRFSPMLNEFGNFSAAVDRAVVLRTPVAIDAPWPVALQRVEGDSKEGGSA